MKLDELLSVLNEYKPSVMGSTEVLGITADTRNLLPGFIFIAIKGHHIDGHSKISEAFSKGAIAVVAEKNQNKENKVLIVKNTRIALSQLAQKFYSFPTNSLYCLGVTGTNGKTSCTYIFEQILNNSNQLTGVIGTINHHCKEKIWPTSQTTPDPITLQMRLSEMKAEGAKAIAMEVSSHALVQKRVDGVQFDTVMFTNLTHDHLDYHKTMDHYFYAKQLLFSDYLWNSNKKLKTAIINIDDKWGKLIHVPNECRLWTYGQGESDFKFKMLREEFSFSEIEIQNEGRVYILKTPLIGLHNAYNCVGSIAAAIAAGISMEKCISSLSEFTGLPGRMQKIENSKGLHVFIDYAHTPDGLLNVLNVIRRVKARNKMSSRVFTIFGCGGDRDKNKRPQMAKIAEKLSNFVMITSDNPRSEDPMSIITEIKAGLNSDKNCFIEPDRKKAFVNVINQAQAGDVILVAGKGHEEYQIIQDKTIPFSDYQEMKELLK